MPDCSGENCCGRNCHPTTSRVFTLPPLGLETALIQSPLLPGLFRKSKLTLARFNWAARKLHKRLLQLDAKEIYPRGEADEQHEEG